MIPPACICGHFESLHERSSGECARTGCRCTHYTSPRTAVGSTMPDCICGHPYAEHRHGATTRCLLLSCGCRSYASPRERVATPDETSPCACGHPFARHAGPSADPCLQAGCDCPDFTERTTMFYCTCTHPHAVHERSSGECARTGCTCTQYTAERATDQPDTEAPPGPPLYTLDGAATRRATLVSFILGFTCEDGEALLRRDAEHLADILIEHRWVI